MRGVLRMDHWLILYIDDNAHTIRGFCGNFFVLRRSCAPPPPPQVCKWIHFHLPGQINAIKFSSRSIFKKTDKCFGVCIVNMSMAWTLCSPHPSQYHWNPLLRIKNILRNIFDWAFWRWIPLYSHVIAREASLIGTIAWDVYLGFSLCRGGRINY